MFKLLNSLRSTTLKCVPGSQKINDFIVNFFPGSVEELHALNEKLTVEADFVEIPTKSPRLSQLKSVLPVFVVPGFKPKLVRSLYEQLLYPVFEARLPENVNSIDELAENLVEVIENRPGPGFA